MSKVLIGVATAEFARRADFYDYFNAFQKPENSICTFAHGQSPARNRNLIIEQALNLGCTHVFFMDDDVILPFDALTRLLTHDKDIVSGLYLMRNYPHKPIAFDTYDDAGRCHHLDIQNKSGLIEVCATGLGCLLIKTDVFRQLEKPWIRMGELESDTWCDDLGFYKRAREAGYTGWLDTDVCVGHILSAILKPVFANGVWNFSYDTGGTGIIGQVMQ